MIIVSGKGGPDLQSMLNGRVGFLVARKLSHRSVHFCDDKLDSMDILRQSTKHGNNIHTGAVPSVQQVQNPVRRELHNVTWQIVGVELAQLRLTLIVLTEVTLFKRNKTR